jgi:hypothetical protein
MTKPNRRISYITNKRLDFIKTKLSYSFLCYSSFNDSAEDKPDATGTDEDKKNGLGSTSKVNNDFM